MQKVIEIPDKTIPVINEKGEKVKDQKVFVYLLGVVIESTAQNSDTETFLAHAIREKLDALQPDHESMQLEESELSFIANGISKLRSQGKVAGSNWYYLVSALNAAKVVKGRKDSTAV